EAVEQVLGELRRTVADGGEVHPRVPVVEQVEVRDEPGELRLVEVERQCARAVQERGHQNASPGTRTQPSMRIRALRLMMALVTVHSPFTWAASAPTRSVPEGWPKRTALRVPPPAARLTSVPGMAAAVPIATAAVPIIAWCSLPIDSARTRRSISWALICLPLDAV